MFRKLKARRTRAARFREMFREIDRLADQAITAAADAFESGEFGWTRGNLLLTSEGYGTQGNDDQSLARATKGCLLGGISKYAWIVTGKPTYGTPEWRLAKAVEVRAYQRAFVSTITENGVVPQSLNDRTAVVVNTVVQALRDSLGKDAELLPDVSSETLGNRIENEATNPYSGDRSELLQELYAEQQDA